MAWQEHKISSCCTFLPLQLSLSLLEAAGVLQLQELIELKNSTLSYKHSSHIGFAMNHKPFELLNIDSSVVLDWKFLETSETAISNN